MKLNEYVKQFSLEEFKIHTTNYIHFKTL